MMGDAGNGCNGTDGGTVAHDEPGVGSERDGCCEGQCGTIPLPAVRLTREIKEG
jgi:hypothetical protein